MWRCYMRSVMINVIGCGDALSCKRHGVHTWPNNKSKCRTVIQAHHTEVIASCSELLSLHCLRHQLFLALLPALGGLLVIMRQDCSAYAEEPLRTVGLLEAAHQYSLQDVHGSTSTPIPLYALQRRVSLTTCYIHNRQMLESWYVLFCPSARHSRGQAEKNKKLTAP